MFGDYEDPKKKERLHSEKLFAEKHGGLEVDKYRTADKDEDVKDGRVTLSGYKALNVRKSPSLDAPILGTIVDGDMVTIYETESTGTFYKIRTVSGLVGFSLRDQIKVDE